MSTARFVVADVFDGLASLEDDSVDLVFTSPPFLALRSYLPADHPDKGKEIGSEATPAAFIDTLLDVVEACDRVLAPHGSLCFELGDTYSGSGGAGGDWSDSPATTKARVIGGSAGGPQRRTIGDAWPLDKSLTGIPTLFAWSLAYGRNLLRPERETPRWRIRNLVPWCRPNPPVGALGDKWRPATSYVTVACKARDRWFDLDAVREPARFPDAKHTASRRPMAPCPNCGASVIQTPSVGAQPCAYCGVMLPKADAPDAQPGNTERSRGVMENNPNGAPPLDFLVLPTAPYKGAHYATFPPGLVTPFVRSMCPREVCRVCGEPRRRIVDAEQFTQRHDGTLDPKGGWKAGVNPERSVTATDSAYRDQGLVRVARTLGWTECTCSQKAEIHSGSEHDDYRPGVVLDPFAGSGTTLMVATGEGRDAIGIDLDARNADLARERCGMFLTVEGQVA